MPRILPTSRKYWRKILQQTAFYPAVNTTFKYISIQQKTLSTILIYPAENTASSSYLLSRNTTFNSYLFSRKYRRKIPAENTGGKYRRKIPAENTGGEYRQKIPAENTAENTGGKYRGKYQRKILHLIHIYHASI